MGLFDFFRRQPPIREVERLADFIDEQAAFLVQKGMYDYARARSGPMPSVCSPRPNSSKAINHSRWRAYPLGLAMVGEMVEGVLHPHSGEDRRALARSRSSRWCSMFSIAIRCRPRLAQIFGRTRAPSLRNGSIRSARIRPSA